MWQKVRMASGIHGRNGLMMVSAFCVGATAHAQYELGASVGAYVYEMYTPRNSPHSGEYEEDRSIPFIASVWYRERSEKGVGLGLEVQWTRKAFHANYSDGGLGSGVQYTSDVRADFLHVNIVPEIRLDRKGRLMLRTGPQIGFLVGGTESGSYTSWSIVSGRSNGTINGGRFDKQYGGDGRWLLSFGFWTALNERFSLSLDPYVSLGISSIHDEPTMKSIDGGLKVSLGLRIPQRTIWQCLRAGALRVRMKEGY